MQAWQNVPIQCSIPLQFSQDAAGIPTLATRDGWLYSARSVGDSAATLARIAPSMRVTHIEPTHIILAGTNPADKLTFDLVTQTVTHARNPSYKTLITRLAATLDTLK